MTDQQQRSLTEQWEAKEEADRERAEEHAADRWDREIEPAQRGKYAERALAQWDEDIEPGQREKYIADALAQWENGSDERRKRFLDAEQ